MILVRFLRIQNISSYFFQEINYLVNSFTIIQNKKIMDLEGEPVVQEKKQRQRKKKKDVAETNQIKQQIKHLKSQKNKQPVKKSQKTELLSQLLQSQKLLISLFNLKNKPNNDPNIFGSLTLSWIIRNIQPQQFKNYLQKYLSQKAYAVAVAGKIPELWRKIQKGIDSLFKPTFSFQSRFANIIASCLDQVRHIIQSTLDNELGNQMFQTVSTPLVLPTIIIYKIQLSEQEVVKIFTDLIKLQLLHHAVILSNRFHKYKFLNIMKPFVKQAIKVQKWQCLHRLHHRKEIEKTNFFVAEKKSLQTQIISNLIDKYGWKPIFDSLARNYLTLLVGWINEFFKKKSSKDLTIKQLQEIKQIIGKNPIIESGFTISTKMEFKKLNQILKQNKCNFSQSKNQNKSENEKFQIGDFCPVYQGNIDECVNLVNRRQKENEEKLFLRIEHILKEIVRNKEKIEQKLLIQYHQLDHKSEIEQIRIFLDLLLNPLWTRIHPLHEQAHYLVLCIPEAQSFDNTQHQAPYDLEVYVIDADYLAGKTPLKNIVRELITTILNTDGNHFITTQSLQIAYAIFNLIGLQTIQPIYRQEILPRFGKLAQNRSILFFSSNKSCLYNKNDSQRFDFNEESFAERILINKKRYLPVFVNWSSQPITKEMKQELFLKTLILDKLFQFQIAQNLLFNELKTIFQIQKVKLICNNSTKKVQFKRIAQMSQKKQTKKDTVPISKNSQTTKQEFQAIMHDTESTMARFSTTRVTYQCQSQLHQQQMQSANKAPTIINKKVVQSSFQNTESLFEPKTELLKIIEMGRQRLKLKKQTPQKYHYQHTFSKLTEQKQGNINVNGKKMELKSSIFDIDTLIRMNQQESEYFLHYISQKQNLENEQYKETKKYNILKKQRLPPKEEKNFFENLNKHFKKQPSSIKFFLSNLSIAFFKIFLLWRFQTSSVIQFINTYQSALGILRKILNYKRSQEYPQKLRNLLKSDLNNQQFLDRFQALESYQLGTTEIKAQIFQKLLFRLQIIDYQKFLQCLIAYGSTRKLTAKSLKRIHFFEEKFQFAAIYFRFLFNNLTKDIISKVSERIIIFVKEFYFCYKNFTAKQFMLKRYNFCALLMKQNLTNEMINYLSYSEAQNEAIKRIVQKYKNVDIKTYYQWFQSKSICLQRQLIQFCLKHQSTQFPVLRKVYEILTNLLQLSTKDFFELYFYQFEINRDKCIFDLLVYLVFFKVNIRKDQIITNHSDFAGIIEQFFGIKQDIENDVEIIKKSFCNLKYLVHRLSHKFKDSKLGQKWIKQWYSNRVQLKKNQIEKIQKQMLEIPLGTDTSKAKFIWINSNLINKIQSIFCEIKQDVIGEDIISLQIHKNQFFNQFQPLCKQIALITISTRKMIFCFDLRQSQRAQQGNEENHNHFKDGAMRFISELLVQFSSVQRKYIIMSYPESIVNLGMFGYIFNHKIKQQIFKVTNSGFYRVKQSCISLSQELAQVLKCKYFKEKADLDENVQLLKDLKQENKNYILSQWYRMIFKRQLSQFDNVIFGDTCFRQWWNNFDNSYHSEQFSYLQAQYQQMYISFTSRILLFVGSGIIQIKNKYKSAFQKIFQKENQSQLNSENQTLKQIQQHQQMQSNYLSLAHQKISKIQDKLERLEQTRKEMYTELIQKWKLDLFQSKIFTQKQYNQLKAFIAKFIF